MSLQGQRVFITGGSSGIGRAMALEAAARGASVWICASRSDGLVDTVDAMRSVARSGGQRFGFTQVDVSDRTAVFAMAPEVLAGLGGLDLLVNNAGVATVGRIEETPPQDYERMMAVNYFGTVWVTRAFLPTFLAQQHGTICCIASTLGVVGLFGYGPYAASKFAVVGFCDCLRQDLLRHGVHVSVVLPADVDTPQLRANMARKPEETRALAGVARLMSAEQAAREILDGVLAGRHRVVTGRANRWILRASRWVPGLMRWVIDRILWRTWHRLYGASQKAG